VGELGRLTGAHLPRLRVSFCCAGHWYSEGCEFGWLLPNDVAASEEEIGEFTALSSLLGG
jgi:hypothetical protein